MEGILPSKMQWGDFKIELNGGKQEDADFYFERQLEFCNKQNQLGRICSEQLYTLRQMSMSLLKNSEEGSTK